MPKITRHGGPSFAGQDAGVAESVDPVEGVEERTELPELPELPSTNDKKEVWVAHATELGMDPKAADELSKRDLVAVVRAVHDRTHYVDSEGLVVEVDTASDGAGGSGQGEGGEGDTGGADPANTSDPDGD